MYLGDLGRHGYFGYCTTDDDAAWHSRRVSAYCVLDNDYLDPRLGLDSPIAGLRATAAHELFHAVQFAYDWLEDLWLMEGTATWIEDVTFPGVHDSLRCLPRTRSAGRTCRSTWDAAASSTGTGSSGVTPPSGSGAASSARRGSGPGATCTPSLPRGGAVAGRGLSIPRLFAGFAAANRVPATAYREGHLYPRAQAFAAYGLGDARPAVSGSTGVAHLSKTIAFRAASALGPRSLALELTVGRGIASSRVTALVVRPGGDVERRRILLDGNGSGRAVVPFGLGVRRVDLVLANAGTGYRWRGTALSCGGISLDDGRPFTSSAALR